MSETTEKHEWVSKSDECTKCNYDDHRCHFCGENLDHESYDPQGNRHWLSDCRPDLVKHEPGELCTWPHRSAEDINCYALQDRNTHEWGPDHIHFYPDGPMV